jgi:hypothetical protein
LEHIVPTTSHTFSAKKRALAAANATLANDNIPKLKSRCLRQSDPSVKEKEDA